MDHTYALIPHNHGQREVGCSKQEKLKQEMIRNLLSAKENIIETASELCKDQYLSNQNLLAQMKKDIEEIFRHPIVQSNQWIYCQANTLIQDYNKLINLLNNPKPIDTIGAKNYLKRQIVKLQCVLGIKPSYDSAVIFLVEQIKSTQVSEARTKQKMKTMI